MAVSTEFKLVQAVIGLLSDRSKWTQGYYARTKTGGYVDARDPNAICWCIAGACLKTIDSYYVVDPPFMTSLLARIPEGTIRFSTANFNDNSTYEQVMTRLREIEIELSKQGE